MVLCFSIMYIIKFSVYLMLFVSTTQEEECGRTSCNTSSDCPIEYGCFADGNHTGSCEPLGSSCASNDCKSSTSLVYNGTSQQCSGSSCCIHGMGYRLYSCSPQLQQVNRASMHLANVSDLNSTCSTQSAYTSDDAVVALATGWISLNNRALCLTNINITAPNNRSVAAKVVTECKSAVGCDLESSFRQPCAFDAVAATQAVWRALGYDPGETGTLKNITWSSISELTTDIRGQNRDRSITTLVVVITVVSVILCLVVGGTRLWRKRKLRERLSSVQDMQLDSLPHQFRYHHLQRATRNFSESLKLGEGGFGSVFKAKLNDGSLVAVKRMDLDIQGSLTGLGQFMAEVMSIGSIHHFNLVRLKGFCINGRACLLVYEFMCNGSLDKWIFHEEKHKLNWKMRQSIALDVARGLDYLHEGCREQVLHLDIKPQNILMDENMRARISDFGLCKLAERGKSYVVSGLRGTPGYMAPEWLNSSVTDKTDVYSYGVVLLQLVSFRKPMQASTASTASESSSMLGLGTVAKDLYLSGDIIRLIDDGLLNEMDVELKDVVDYVKIGLWCIQDDPAVRPSMRRVLNMLEGTIDVPDLKNINP